MKGRFALFPHAASSIAGRVDALMLALLVLCGLIMAIVFGMMIVFSVLYRDGAERNRELKKTGQSILEWGWTGATFMVFMGIFAWGAVTYFEMVTPPPGASEVKVLAKQWMWKFQHPDGRRELNELHVPVGQPILLTMTSQDVIHSFFVPDFRIKQDVLPDRYTEIWFKAEHPGEFHLFCTQYCGTMHAEMRGKVIVMSREDYQHWLQSGTPPGPDEPEGVGRLSMASRGQKLFTRLGCISCHGTNPGTIAPSLFGIYGKKEGLSNGKTVLVDENYLRESILSPRAKIVQGYQPVMPSFAAQANEEDVMDLIAYIKSLQATPKAHSPGGSP